MGFFKKLFKKKKGGTFFGNLIRGVANKASGGILGNGVALARNDAKIDQREYERQQRQIQAGANVFNAHPQSRQVANFSANLTKDAEKGYLKKNALKIVGVVVGIVGVTIAIVKSMARGKKKY